MKMWLDFHFAPPAVLLFYKGNLTSYEFKRHLIFGVILICSKKEGMIFFFF